MDAEIRRVLMIGDAVGGIWTYALDLARVLASRGTHVTLATMGPRPSSSQMQDAAAISSLDVVVSDFKLEWMDDPWTDVAAAGSWQLERVARPDIVHLNGFAHGSLPWQTPVVAVGHSCLLSWADAIPGAIADEKLEPYRERAARGLAAAEWVAAPSAAMLASLLRHYGPLRHVSVICNGRNPEPFKPARKEPFVFSAGRLWDQAKNVETLASIAARLPWPVAIAGADRPPEDAQGHPFGGVRCLGVLPERAIAAWLSRAAIFALPARYEPFGLLPLEAALSGCALVLGDTPSLREVWDDAADYVDPGDAAALHLAIVRLASSPTLLEKRARAARARAERYTPQRMADGYFDIYRRAVERYNRCAS
jgi:glycogen synthase